MTLRLRIAAVARITENSNLSKVVRSAIHEFDRVDRPADSIDIERSPTRELRRIQTKER